MNVNAARDCGATALVIGGTGPTGPYVVSGLIERGFQVTLLHRGRHEVDMNTTVTHLHADPHFRDSLAEALGDLKYDLIVATYGRLRYLPSVLKNRATRLIAVSGATYQPMPGLNAVEKSPRVMHPRMYERIVETEEALFRGHAAGQYGLTLIRYAHLYGPRQLAPREWSIIRRLLDGRKQIVVTEAGLIMRSQVSSWNAASAILAAVDRPDVAFGRVYNATDQVTVSDADRIRLIADVMGAEVELISVPAHVGLPRWYWGMSRSQRVPGMQNPKVEHELVSSEKIRRELNFRDAIDLTSALRKTVEWYIQNPPVAGGEVERQLGDPFDYDWEDQLITWWRSLPGASPVRSVPEVPYRHPYDHPVDTGIDRSGTG